MTPQRTDIDFGEFRTILMKERDRLRLLHQHQRGDMQAEMEDASANDVSPINAFDDADNEDTAAALAEHDREEIADENTLQRLSEIEKALERLSEGTYGLDEITGEPIPVQRLRAIPWATMTVETASRYEE